ncbi:MAG: hypothetical protein J0I32_03905 [Sphingobacteriales bacterium]|nr:hypothetical protein [Sphingobacteriales bacterium]OJW05145.1 MAG: hypothetical protein BGO52_21970 [Sphingobacteriales bacterium 44-61]
MISQHILEEDIQLYVLDASQVKEETMQHLEHCTACQARVREYEMLFTGIGSLPKALFDFDVAALVLPQLPEKKKVSSYKIAGIAMVVIAAGLISLLFILLQYRLNELWQNISPWVIGLISVVAVAFIGISLWEMYERYRQQLKKLNFE